MKPKILNSQLQVQPKCDDTIIDSIEATADGNIQIVTFNEEYLDENDWEVKCKEEKPNKTDDTIYTCKVCDRSFPLVQQLEIHKLNHVRERNHPCDSCEKSFFTKYDLAKHTLTHTKQKDYTCIVCSKSFSRSTLLYRHEKIHNDANIPRYHCVECDRVYLNPMDYEKHSITHTKTRKFECKYCDKRFAFKQGLERHEVIHDNNSQPHPCQYCDLRFPSAARLQRHLSSEHAGKRPFPCGKCSKRFMLSHHLYRHMRTTHISQEEIVSYQCQECDETFSDRMDFFNHCNEHADYTLVCPLCKMSFESNKEASDHILLHANSDMYYCDYCNSIFMDQEKLNEHFMDEHSEELCSVGEEFELVVEDKPKTVSFPKKRKNEENDEPAGKKMKNSDIAYNIKQGDGEDYEFLEEDQYAVSEIDGAAFVEYEEIEAYEPPKSESPKKTVERKVYARPQEVKKSPAEEPRKLPMRAKVVKMSPARIAQLKKEGKIEMKDGNLVMKQ